MIFSIIIGGALLKLPWSDNRSTDLISQSCG